jgi:hypothetical protein
MTQAFSQRISELQQLVCFRVEGEKRTPSKSACSSTAAPLNCVRRTTEHAFSHLLVLYKMGLPAMFKILQIV